MKSGAFWGGIGGGGVFYNKPTMYVYARVYTKHLFWCQHKERKLVSLNVLTKIESVTNTK